MKYDEEYYVLTEGDVASLEINTEKTKIIEFQEGQSR